MSDELKNLLRTYLIEECYSENPEDWEIEQEYNLIYVAITRSQGTLVDVVT